jgi:hypothetical protein
MAAGMPGQDKSGGGFRQLSSSDRKKQKSKRKQAKKDRKKGRRK